MRTVLCPSIVICNEILEDGPDGGPRRIRPGSCLRTLGVYLEVIIRLPCDFGIVQVEQAMKSSFENQTLI